MVDPLDGLQRERIARGGATGNACRCETTIPGSLLEGYACGNAKCWRTAEAKASFDVFVTALIRQRGEVPHPKR